MNQKIKVKVNGHAYLVEVDDLTASPLIVKVNGQRYEVGLEMVEETESAPDSPVPSVSSVSPVSARAQTTSNGPGAVTAPMPGNIVEIFVQAGDKIGKEQPLCSLEAMKMQNAIRSSRDGVIATVEVRPGQAVGHGDLLFTFE